jgi:hypothetical protein
MYINEKMVHLETISVKGGRGTKENDGGGKFKYEILIYCKNFHKCCNGSPIQYNNKKYI